MEEACQNEEAWELPTGLESVFVSAAEFFSYVATDFVFVIFTTLNFLDKQLSQRGPSEDCLKNGTCLYSHS